MELLANFFVQKPINILIVAAIFFAAYIVLRLKHTKENGHHRSMLITAIAWGFYALWEFWVNVKTPEADIRVDLLLIWPILIILSAWAIFKSFR